jgi:hypothetical protein
MGDYTLDNPFFGITGVVSRGGTLKFGTIYLEVWHHIFWDMIENSRKDSFN